MEQVGRAGATPAGLASESPQSYLRTSGDDPVRVLVVDDEPDLADMVATTLRFDGCRTATAGDADEAMRVARELRPDIAVLDVMLPGQDGVSLLARLRSRRTRPAGRAPHRAGATPATGSPGSAPAPMTT